MVFENIEHLSLDGVCVCVCLFVCLLVSGCVVSLAELLVCVLVSSRGTKITFPFLRVIHMKQRLGKQLIDLFNHGDENSGRVLYVFAAAGRSSYVPFQRMFICFPLPLFLRNILYFSLKIEIM